MGRRIILQTKELQMRIMPQNTQELQSLAKELKITKTIWDIEGTNFDDIAFGDEAEFIRYSCFGHSIQFPLSGKETWKDIWSTVDYMVMCVEMGDHVWIESFDIEDSIAILFLES
jgi:hypothetical protein